MKRFLVSAVALALAALAASAGETSNLVKTRLSPSSAARPNVWLSSFSKARSYALANDLPLVAVWSNGDACSHCVKFESACNSTYFRNWMKTSGCVFYFTYPGDKGDGKVGSSVFHWIRKGNTSYPFIRIYWPAGGVDVATVGDTMDGNAKGADGGKNVAAYIKKKCSRFFAKTVVVKPYTVVFQPNGGTGEMADKKTKVGITFTLPANTFKRTYYSFAGWAKSASGSVVYKNKASVKNLTTVSNGVVNLYARWTRTTYGPYYVGLSSTVTMPSSLKGYTTSTKIPGMKWSPSKYRWTGKPTKAGTFKVKYKKGSKTVTRNVLVVKDSVVLSDESVASTVFASGKDMNVEISPSSRAGAVTVNSVSGLPAGLEYADGVISGSTAMSGSFKVTLTVTSAANQKLTRSFYLNIGVPECCIGTFNGFVGFADTNRIDELAFINRGTFQLSAPSNANLSAKVVTAKGTYSFTGVGWLDNGNGTYTASLLSSAGKDAVVVTVGSNIPPYESICRCGAFTPSYGTEYEVWAQRAPFARAADGTYLNPLADAVMDSVVGKWYFKAYAVGSQWVFLYSTAAAANVTLTVSSDGTAKMAGKIGSYAISSSSAIFVFSGDIEKGFVRADFPVPVTVSKAKKTLDIWTNLWFDRSNGHFNERGESIGGASVEDFQ